MKKFKFIDLFSGVGGFHQAMCQIGGECVFASEIDKFCTETYMENYGINSQYDITDVRVEDIPKHDVLCAGFPCQAFSKAGKQSGMDDARGTLFFEIARILKYHKTKYIILENVFFFYLCALLASFGLILICKNCKYFPQIGYFGKNSLVVMCTHVNCYILYAAILIAWQIDTIVTRAKSYIFLFNIMIFTFLFEAILIQIINRFFPFILGKKPFGKTLTAEDTWTQKSV